MKIYFSIWGYSDPTRVGYDTAGVTYYHTEKPSPFAGIGSSKVYEVELPDTFSNEEARAIGKRAEALMEETNDYNPLYAVVQVLKEMK